MKRGLLLSSVVAVIAVMALFGVIYASENIIIENINEDTAAATDYKTMKSAGKGTSFVNVLYAGFRGSQTGNPCLNISPWRCHLGNAKVYAYCKWWNMVAGYTDIFFILTDNGGHVVSMKQISDWLNSGPCTSCVDFTPGPGEYFLSLVISAADGLLVSPESYYFILN